MLLDSNLIIYAARPEHEELRDLIVQEVLSVSESVVAEAIRLRQQRSMSLGDALIAGTALSHDVSLATHDTTDFQYDRQYDRL